MQSLQKKMTKDMDYVKFTISIIHIMRIYSFPDSDYDHATTSRGIWILYYNGEIIEVTLDYDIDQTLRPKQFHRIWKLLNLYPKRTTSSSTNKIIELLNIILKAYGYSTREQIPNYTMELQNLIEEK